MLDLAHITLESLIKLAEPGQTIDHLPLGEWSVDEAEIYQPLEEAELVTEAEAVVSGQLELLQQQQAQTQTIIQAAEQVIAQLHTTRSELAPAHNRVAIPADVRAEAQALLAQSPIILDYETTGLRRKAYDYGYYASKPWAKVHQVLGAALVDSASGDVLFQARLNPQRPISPGASRTHGLTDGDVAHLPTWQQLEPALYSYLHGQTVVAYNAGFDASFTPDWSINWICAKALTDRALGVYTYPETEDWRKSATLVNRLKQCGLQPGPAHTPAGDAVSTAKLLHYLAGQTI